MEELRSADELLEGSQRYDQIAPEMGFREYWYPLCLAEEVTERGLEMTPLGSPVLLLRRSGKIYAVANECPHRGTRLSLGRCQFPGTNTLTCVYHGWTYDVTNGNCVAALTDGPDSPLINKVRLKTYPVTECQGIVWIWMGKEQAVAPEVDIPAGIRRATVVKVVRRNVYGNWRWHIENPGTGHALMLHRNSVYVRIRRFFGFMDGGLVMPTLEEDEDGVWLCEYTGMPVLQGSFPGLGIWPRKRFGEGIIGNKISPLLGAKSLVSKRLPGVARVIHFPINDALYYEWYVQTDPNHYLYFQVCCGFPTSLADRAWFLLRYQLGGRQTGMVWFNAQDCVMVRESHNYARRHGRWNPPSRFFRPDIYELAWRHYAAKYARGVGSAVLDGGHAEGASLRPAAESGAAAKGASPSA